MKKKTPVLAVAAIKGGTGKTATAGALSFAAYHSDKKVLAVDMDPQCNLSFWLGGKPSEKGVLDVLIGHADPAGLIQHPECGIDILTGSANLAALQTSSGSARRLWTSLETIKKEYDLVVIDTGPTLSETLNNALCTATQLIIPLEADTYSLQGLYQLLDVAGNVAPDLIISGVLITKFDQRPNINRFMRDTIVDTAKKQKIPYLGEVRQGVALREAMSTGTDLYVYAPKSKPAEDYMAIYHTLFERS